MKIDFNDPNLDWNTVVDNSNSGSEKLNRLKTAVHSNIQRLTSPKVLGTNSALRLYERTLSSWNINARPRTIEILFERTADDCRWGIKVSFDGTLNVVFIPDVHDLDEKLFVECGQSSSLPSSVHLTKMYASRGSFMEGMVRIFPELREMVSSLLEFAD
jgi:hypothetical protein